MRRNLSNVAQIDFANTIMEDVSRMTITRAECKAGAALLMSSRLFFQGMKYEFEDDDRTNNPGSSSSTKAAFYSYRQDATNHRNKKCTMELDAAYCVVPSEDLGKCDDDDDDGQSDMVNDLWNRFISGIRRVSDVLPVSDETGAGCLGFTQKAFRSLGCPDWQTTQEEWILCPV